MANGGSTPTPPLQQSLTGKHQTARLGIWFGNGRVNYMEVITLQLDEIRPYANNTKEHPQEQIDEIKESIARYGMNDPIAVWGKSNTIVEGHGRFEALRQMGIKEVPCIRLDHLTDKQRREYTIAHNKTTMDSGFDKNMLSLELPGLDLGFLGYADEPEEEEDDGYYGDE